MESYWTFYFEKSEYTKPDVRTFILSYQNIHLTPVHSGGR